jgi:hypothetical protein
MRLSLHHLILYICISSLNNPKQNTVHPNCMAKMMCEFVFCIYFMQKVLLRENIPTYFKTGYCSL